MDNPNLEYRVVIKTGFGHGVSETLSEEISDLLALGWELYGSLSLSTKGTHGEIAIAQALTRTKENRMIYEMIG